MLGLNNYYLEITAAFVVWNIVLSVVLVTALYKYRRLTKGTDRKSLSAILERQVTISEAQALSLKKIENQVQSLTVDAQSHLRKVRLVRFNPYNDVGGDQSFAVVLLDSNKNGLSLASLHGREGTRLYAKTVEGGVGQEYPLSAEEKTAIEQSD